jgi:hypothetical protein
LKENGFIGWNKEWHLNSCKKQNLILVNEVTYLKSIKELLPEDCYKTGGSRPVKIFCNDFNEYVCKYFNGEGVASSLFNEYLAASFLKLWNLNVPDFAFVRVQKDHLYRMIFPFHYFKAPCYGSLFNPGYKEVDKILINFQFQHEQLLKLLTQYLKIGLFDIWLCNEDRTFGNMNMMFDVENINFIPIDHVQIFNGNNIEREPIIITEEESILHTPFIHKLFLRTLQQNCKELRTTIISDFSRNVISCHENLQAILQAVPPEWGLDRVLLNSRLKNYFTKDWQKKTLYAYFTYSNTP